jgi:hypothetical protein
MFFNSRNLFRLAASTVLAAGFAAAAHADVVYDNMGGVSDFSEAAFNGPLAQSFNSGNGGQLNGIDLMLTSSSGSLGGGIQITLVADNGTSPGATVVSLGTLSNGAVPTSANGTFDFKPLSDVDLAANTTYWVEISSLGANGIEWAGSSDLSDTGVAGQSLSDPGAGGVFQVSDVGEAFQMAVDVPEPGTVALFMSGLLGIALLRRRSRMM